jgi:hypothetical protein
MAFLKTAAGARITSVIWSQTLQKAIFKPVVIRMVTEDADR